MSDAMRSQDVFGRINKISHIIKLQTHKYKVDIAKYPPHDQQWHIQFSPWPAIYTVLPMTKTRTQLSPWPAPSPVHSCHIAMTQHRQWFEIQCWNAFICIQRTKIRYCFFRFNFPFGDFWNGNFFFSLPSSPLNSLLSAKTG